NSKTILKMKKQLITKALALSLLLSSALTLTDAQNACINKQKTLGGSGDDYPTSTIKVCGGYVISGYTNSADGSFNVPANHDFDGFIAKFDYSGHVIWKHTYGGTAYDDLWNIKSTTDGGYIATGETSSNDGDVSGNHGGDEDVWVVKFNSLGLIQWQKCFGGSGDDYTFEINVTPSGYTVVGATNSNDGNVSGNHGDYDAWVINISHSGNLISSHCYGGSGQDAAVSYKRNNNGTFTFCGGTYSNDGDVNGNHGGQDTWLVNANFNFNINWQKCMGGSGDEYPHTFARTTDGNIVLSAPSLSNDGDVDGNPGYAVAWLVKVNPKTGNIIWNKTYKNANLTTASVGAFGTSDGGVISMGGIGDNLNFSTDDAFVFKVNSNGNMQWEKQYGGSDQDDYGFWFSGIQLGNQYVISTATLSNDGDVHNPRGGVDAWIVTLGSCCGHKDALTDENDFSLSNYPNPISSSTTISFALNQPQNISAKIYDATGKVITTLCENKSFEEGENQLEWNVENVDAGIYFLKVEGENFSETKKLSVVK
ncbi:MAG: T9SS type A sorting domain-containing protein, partial [Bacteroidia bacterium]